MEHMATATPPARRANNVRPPLTLPVIALILVVIAQILRPQVEAQTPEWKASNVLSTGIPFVMEFIAIILVFAFLIFVVAMLLNNRISHRLYTIIEWIIIAGVAFGVFGMFQPWQLGGYSVGFHVLLICFIAFNVWSHVTPRPVPAQSVSEKLN